MVLILFATLGVMQIVLFKWKTLHFRSYQQVTLFGMWLFPLIFNVRAGWWRMVSVWTLFTLITFFVIYQATQQEMG